MDQMFHKSGVEIWSRDMFVTFRRVVRVSAQTACRANSQSGKHYPWKPSCPWRQYCSTALIIKILLMPLTGPHSPPLCRYLCCYLKWVYDNEMFTIRDPRTCSYGGPEEEITDLQSLRAVRGWGLWLFHQVPCLRAQGWIALHNDIYFHLQWTNWQWVKITAP